MLGRIKSQFNAAQEHAEKLSSMNAKAIESTQLKCLQQAWSEAVVRVPYYKTLVRKKLAPAEIRNWEDYSQIPILDRATLQEKQQEFQREAIPDQTRETGGSTGIPVKIGVWNREADGHRIAKLMLWQKAGYMPSDKLFLIWGHAHLLGTGWKGILNDRIRKLKDFALGYKRVDAYSLSREKCEDIARQLIAFRPSGLIGYASALDYFLRTTEKYHKDFAALKLRFVMPAAEMSPRKDSYDLIFSVFGCPIVEEYGGVEFGQVAMRFHLDSFRVFHDRNFVEAIPESGNSTNERVLVTTLYERYVPLFRYAPGDLITEPKRMSHGHVESFKKVEGRINDLVKLQHGGVLHSVSLFHCVHQEPGVLNIQLVLRNNGPRLQLVVSAAYNLKCEQRIRSRLKDIAPELQDVPISLVSDVTTTRAGKRRWVHDERSSNHK